MNDTHIPVHKWTVSANCYCFVSLLFSFCFVSVSFVFFFNSSEYSYITVHLQLWHYNFLKIKEKNLITDCTLFFSSFFFIFYCIRSRFFHLSFLFICFCFWHFGCRSSLHIYEQRTYYKCKWDRNVYVCAFMHAFRSLHMLHHCNGFDTNRRLVNFKILTQLK